MSSRWNGRVVLDAGSILYLGPGAPASEHAHHAVQLVWSADGPFSITIDGTTLERTAVLVPANMRHALDASGRRVALLLLEAHGAVGTGLDARARAALGDELAPVLTSVTLDDVIARETTDVAGWVAMLAAALGTANPGSPVSSVSRRAIAHIERSIGDGVPRIGDAARAIGISPTRLTHVFTREVGIPFRRFVLWTRIKRAITAAKDADLTSAAIAAGFTDAAHFSKTFHAMFGLSPSLVIPLAEVTGAL